METGKLVAKDDDPHRIERLARIRFHHENLQAHEMMVFADELDIHLLPKVGAAWMPQGTQVEVMTPGKNEKHYLAGALHLATGKLLLLPWPSQKQWVVSGPLDPAGRHIPSSTDYAYLCRRR